MRVLAGESTTNLLLVDVKRLRTPALCTVPRLVHGRGKPGRLPSALQQSSMMVGW